MGGAESKPSNEADGLRKDTKKVTKEGNASSATAETKGNTDISCQTTEGNTYHAEDKVASTIIQDRDVHVNLPMADLMEYLQVVAKNSSNLPLTRRDDPEAGRTISTLTPDEYANKCGAFIPANVRVIGATFSKYGNFWDLPTSEELNAVDGTQEPGITYGGACCNAFLKVLYDTENGTADDVIQQSMSPRDLFEDDDDISLQTKRTMEALVLGDVATSSTISWATLLRKMKAEMHDIEYAQTPKITSSRKFDLEEPFSLLPADFDLKKNKKRSLLIGCNYMCIEDAKLQAGHDDICSMKDYIINVHGFPETEGLMTILLDDDEHKHPTHTNITEALKALSEISEPGDAVFVQFSGHGGRILDAPIDSDTECYDEVIIPSDYRTSGLIRDTLIFKTLLAPLRNGVNLTIMIDTCDTGMVIDLPYSWSTRSDRIEIPPKMTLNNDFSFVRFLKVIKNLYESSVFTELGNTVGAALKFSSDEGDAERDENTTLGDTLNDDDGTFDTLKDDDETFNTDPRLDFGGCLNCVRVVPRKVTDNKSDLDKGGDKTLLEQLMNCTILQDESSVGDRSYHGDDSLLTSDVESRSRHRRKRWLKKI